MQKSKNSTFAQRLNQLPNFDYAQEFAALVSQHGNTPELLQAVIDAKTDKILGVMLLCEESYEMINTVKTAMDFGASYQYLRDNIFTHPTMTEALNDLFSI